MTILIGAGWSFGNMLFFAFCFSVFVQCLFWACIFKPLLRHEPENCTTDSPFVSIIVIYKNEELNLLRIIPQILDQKYPNFELLLVNDFSSDCSEDSISHFRNHPSVRTIKVKVNSPGKKSALREAVAAANGDVILLTDADCLPSSKYWVRSMISHLGYKKEIVLGFSPFKPCKSWLGRFVRFEGWLTGIQYFSLAYMGQAYMGVGRNLAYTKELFAELAPFRNDRIVSGDDDLFVSRASTRNNTAICLRKESFVWTFPAKSWKIFFTQKHRHMKSSLAYKWEHKAILGVFSMSHVILYILLFGLLFTEYCQYAMCIWLLFECLKYWIAKPLLELLNCQDLKPFFLPAQFFLALYYIIMAPALWIPIKKWK